MTEKRKCLAPNCATPAKTRGLCNNHYTSAIYHVKAGHTTWQELEENGKCIPSTMELRNTWLLDFKKNNSNGSTQ